MSDPHHRKQNHIDPPRLTPTPQQLAQQQARERAAYLREQADVADTAALNAYLVERLARQKRDIAGAERAAVVRSAALAAGALLRGEAAALDPSPDAVSPVTAQAVEQRDRALAAARRVVSGVTSTADSIRATVAASVPGGQTVLDTLGLDSSTATQAERAAAQAAAALAAQQQADFAAAAQAAAAKQVAPVPQIRAYWTRDP